MGIGDDELDAAQTAAGELAQKFCPQGLGLRGPDIHAEHLAPAVGVDRDGDDHRGGDDTPETGPPLDESLNFILRNLLLKAFVGKALGMPPIPPNWPYWHLVYDPSGARPRFRVAH